MKVGYEEKTFESYFNNELDSKSSIYFPPGQVLEGFFGFDAAANSRNRKLWSLLGHPMGFDSTYTGVELKDIAQELENNLDVTIQNIPSIKTNLFFQYKRPVYITRSSGKEWGQWKKSYYRYDLYHKQHQLLSKIANSFHNEALVLYASPAISNINELVKFKLKNKIIENSNFRIATDLDNHSRNTYTSSGKFSIAFSEPERLKTLNLMSTLESFDPRHQYENNSFVIKTSKVIIENMKYSKPFHELMAYYDELINYKIIYSLLTMKAFREITGVHWLLSLSHTEKS